MKILSWNVNGIRAIVKKGFLQWLEKESPDILCIQETKSSPDQLTDEILKPQKYFSFWSSAEKKGYSGVGVYTNIKPKDVKEGMGIKKFDSEGRILMLEYPKFTLFNVYFPNGGAGNKRVPFKLGFYENFFKRINKLKNSGKNIILCGDVNTAHTEIDLARPKYNEKNTGFLPEERAWVSKLLKSGYIDTFRHFVKEGDNYTYWDYKTNARARNVGWRIDYFIINEKFLSSLKNSFIINDVTGSDHCPIGIEIE